MIAGLRQQYEDLVRTNDQLTRYRKWMTGPLNNAQLGALALYRDLTPAFKQLFVACDRDFSVFYRRAKEISRRSQEERARLLSSQLEC